MKGSLVDKVANIATLLYLGTKFEGFYATNQEAWIAVQNQSSSEMTGNLAMTVDIVTVFNLGDGEIDIANIQTFWFDQTQRVYNTGSSRGVSSLKGFKELIRKDWAEAVTE